jgi:mono/diheme cytochrome c family protein
MIMPVDQGIHGIGKFVMQKRTRDLIAVLLLAACAIGLIAVPALRANAKPPYSSIAQETVQAAWLPVVDQGDSAEFQKPAPTQPATYQAGRLADDGKAIFTQVCAECHGLDGRQVNGSPILGPNNVLPDYQTAQGLYDFLISQMPDGDPTSLTAMQHLQVESYLLVADGYIKHDTAIDSKNLGLIPIQ